MVLNDSQCYSVMINNELIWWDPVISGKKRIIWEKSLIDRLIDHWTAHLIIEHNIDRTLAGWLKNGRILTDQSSGENLAKETGLQ